MPNTEIATPRTDTEVARLESTGCDYLFRANFARELERELAVAEEALRGIEKRGLVGPPYCAIASEALRRLAEMRERSGK